MKNTLSPLKTLFSLCLMSFTLVSACDHGEGHSDNDSEKAMPEKQLRHVVLFKFKEGADPAAIKKAEDAFMALPAKIPEIKGFEWGLNNSPEGLEKGFTHCYFLTFNSEEDRAIYLPHPDHQAFGKLLGDILDDVLVVDYWNK
ncbi:MAG: Dabb family protein [Roseivirga sp.]|nr:Dabb family protein [Roseivirga sp.]